MLCYSLTVSIEPKQRCHEILTKDRTEQAKISELQKSEIRAI